MYRATQKGVSQSLKNAEQKWVLMALEIVRRACKKFKTFSVDDVRAKVRASKLKTHDNRAMGGVMLIAKSKGWITGTGRSIPSIVGHRTRIQIWKSLINKS